MNKELYKELGIDENAGLKDILGELENRQFDCLERLETVNDEERRKGLELQLSKIDKEIADIKDQIKSLKNGIILDGDSTDIDTNVVVEPAKDSVKEAEKKKEDVSKKVEALKQKDAEKKEKEAEMQKKAAEDAAKAAQDSLGLNSNANGDNNKVDANPELTKALIDYKNGDYASAFAGFNKLAESDNETAQYMFANMYYRGEGTNKNDERAEYWMKRSADNGYVSAQLDYGIMRLAAAGNAGNDTMAEEGLSYVGKAADNGDKQAILKYIEVAKKQIGGRPAYEKAISYCDTLKKQSSDSYDNEQYDAAKTELNKLRKEAIKIEKKIKFSTVFTIVGAVLSVFGALYLLGGIHPLLWKHNGFLKFIPDAFDFLVVDKLWGLLRQIMNKNGVLGAEMFLLGWTFLEAGNNPLRKKYSFWIEKASLVACVAIGVWHFFALVQEGRSLFTALGWYILVIVAAIIAGTVVGMIVGKIFRTR